MECKPKEALVKTELIKIELEQIQHIATCGYSVGIFMDYTGPVSQYIGYDPEWITDYTEHGLAVSDPTLIWAQNNSGIIRWSGITGYVGSKVQRSSTNHGIFYGATASVIENNRRSIASFSKKNEEFLDIELNVLLASLKKLHLAHTPTEVFSSIEYDVLNHLIQGKTNKEISKALNVSDQTVKVRLSSMKEKLGVSTSPELVYIASKLKLI